MEGIETEEIEKTFVEKRAAFEFAVDGVLRSVTGPIASLKLNLILGHSQECLQRWMSLVLSAGASTIDVSTVNPCFESKFLKWPKIRDFGHPSISLVGLVGAEGLTKLSLDGFIIDRKGYKPGELIAGCPSLTVLELKDCTVDYRKLKITSSSLRSCHISLNDASDSEKLFMLTNCPQLERASISIVPTYNGMDDLLYGPLNKLQFLDICILNHMPHKERISHRLPHELVGLRYLKLDLDLRTLKDLGEAFCILRNSPSLTKLEVSYSQEHYELPLDPDDEELDEEGMPGLAEHGEDWRHSPTFWDMDGWRSVILSQLNSFVLDCDGEEAARGPSYLKFCEFILANSPVLESFTVQIRWREASEEKQEFMIQTRAKLAGLPKASQDVRINVQEL